MGDNLTLILQILLGLGAIFFFVLTYFNTKSWRWLHVLTLFLVFFAAGVSVVMTAFLLKTHDAWRTLYNENVAAVKAAEEENLRLRHGPLDELKQSETTLRSVTGDLQIALRDRGRVWRNVQPGAPAGQGYTVNLAERLPVNVPEDKINPHGFERDKSDVGKMILYAFKEREVPEGMVPSVYLGEFMLASFDFQITKTDTEVDVQSALTLAPLYPLSAAQQAEAARRDGTWVLYETMPLDGHELLAGLDDTQLAELLPRNAIPADRYEATLAEFRRDGGPATADDDPLRQWVRVRFLKAYTVEVDADTDPEPLGDRFFDSQGRALPADIRQGSSTEFEPGNLAVLDPDTAERLIADGTVEKVELVYVRALRDYEFAFQKARRRILLVQTDADKMRRESATIEASTARVNTQLGIRNAEKQKIDADLTAVRREDQVISGVVTALNGQLAGMRDRLSKLYRLNLQYAEELASLQESMARRINSITSSEAPATNP